MDAPLAVEAGETAPHSEAEQEIVQVTPLLLGSLLTAAVKACVPPAGTLAEAGEIVTVMGGGGVTVTVAEADLLGSATEVAMTITVRLADTVAGAV